MKSLTNPARSQKKDQRLKQTVKSKLARLSNKPAKMRSRPARLRTKLSKKKFLPSKMSLLLISSQRKTSKDLLQLLKIKTIGLKPKSRTVQSRLKPESES